MFYKRNNQLNIFLLLLSSSIISIFPTMLLADDIVDISSKDNNISPNNAMSCIVIIGTIFLVAYIFSFQGGDPTDISTIPEITTKIIEKTVSSEIHNLLNKPETKQPNIENIDSYLAGLEMIGK